MTTGLITLAALAGVGGLLRYVWRHRSGTIARGLGAAGARHNELYGQGRPPEMPPSSWYASADGNGEDRVE